MRTLSTLYTAVRQNPILRAAAVLVLIILAAVVWDPSALFALPVAFGATFTEGSLPWEFLVTEAPGHISRRNITLSVAASTTLDPGTVLGKVTSSGKYVPWDDSWSDGRETVAGVLAGEAVNDAAEVADVEGVAIVGVAEVRSDDLVWEDGVSESAGQAGLEALHIRVRE